MPRRDLLAERRTRLLDRLRAVTGSRLAVAFDSLGSYDDEARWYTVASPLVVAAQGRAISTQVAYLEAIIGQRLTFDTGALLERAAVDLREPFIAFANVLDNGGEFDEAVTSGALRAEGVGESSVTYASRAASSTADGHARGWVRLLSASPCDWCQTVAQQTYRSAESASFGHLRCHCEPDPILT